MLAIAAVANVRPAFAGEGRSVPLRDAHAEAPGAIISAAVDGPHVGSDVYDPAPSRDCEVEV
jgi:hypothetical protein